MSASSSRQDRKSISIGRQIIFILTIFIVMLALLEGLSRLVPYRRWIKQTLLMSPTIDLNLAANLAAQGQDAILYNKPDPLLLWRNDPDSGLYDYTNSLGYRGGEFQKAKPDGLTRIALLGDSVTFGWGHEDTATTFPALLEASLNENQVRFQVYNFGVPGYSSYQGLKLLESEVLDYRPDLVCLQYGWNDHWEAYRYPDKDQVRLSLLLSRHRNLMQKSALVGLLQVGVTYGRYFLRTSALVPEPARRRDAPAISATKANLILRVSRNDYQKNLREMIRLTRQSGGQALLATAPHSRQDDICMFRVCFEPKIHQDYNEIVRRLAETENVVLVDLDETFRKNYPSGHQDLYLTHGIHYSPTGHYLAAQTLEEAILRVNP